MAGYILVTTDGAGQEAHPFHIGEPGFREKINRVTNSKARVLTVQLDCDELEAFVRAMESPINKPGWAATK